MRYCFIIFLLIYLIPVHAIDSLKLQIQLEQLEVATDTQRLRILKELSWALRVSDNKKAKTLADEGVSLAAELKDSISYYKIFTSLGIILAVQSNLDESISYLDKAYLFFQKNKERKLESRALGLMGSVLSHFGNYQVADSLLQKTTILYKKLNNKELLLDFSLDWGINSLNWKKYEEAKKIFNDCLSLSEELGDEKTSAKILNNLGLCEAGNNNNVKAIDYYLQASEIGGAGEFFKSQLFNNIGILYHDFGEYDKALEYHEKSLTIKRKLDLKYYIVNSLNNIGSVYTKKLDYGQALTYLKEALSIKTKLEGTNNGTGEILNNIGIVYLELNDYKEAEDYLKRYLEIAEVEEDTFAMSRALGNLADTYRMSGEFNKGITYGRRSLELAEKINFPDIAQTVSKSISESYEALGDVNKMYFYKNKYWVIKDSLYGLEATNKVKELETKYETVKREQALQIKNEQIKNLENQKTIDRLKIGLLIACCAFLAMIIVVMVMRKRKLIEGKNKVESRLDTISKENVFLEQKNTRQQVQLNEYLQQLLTKSEELHDLQNKASQKEENGNAVDSSMHDLLHFGLQSEEGLKQFKFYFSTVHKDFFKKLSISFPNLSNNDLNLAALMKLNLSNKEIAQILNISPPSVKSARQRLYQKMNLADNEALRNFIIQL